MFGLGGGWCFAFHLRGMDDAARILIEGVPAMHGAAVIPQNEISRLPYVVPRKFLPRGVSPQLIQKRFGFGKWQPRDVGVAAAAGVEEPSSGFRMRADQRLASPRRRAGVLGRR